MKRLSCLLPMLMVALMVGPASSTAGDQQGKRPLYATDKSDERIASYSAETQLLIGMDLINGKNAPKDLELADRYFAAAYKLLPKEAAELAGLLYHEVVGGGLYAARWLERAGEHGNIAAYDMIASMYEDGEKIPQDYRKAREFRAKSATVFGLTGLAYLYEHGLGGRRDKFEAEVFYRAAAFRGNANAAWSVARLSSDGRLSIGELIETYAWLIVAQSLGENRGQSEVQRVRQKLTPEQLTTAREKADNYLERIARQKMK